jgi:hypothetical protein
VLPSPNNVSTTAAGSSQNTGGTSSTQTNGGTPHQLLSWAPSPIQVIQGNAEPGQIQVKHWEDEAFEDETTTEVELGRVQQEIVKNKSSITDRPQLSAPKAEGTI